MTTMSKAAKKELILRVQEGCIGELDARKKALILDAVCRARGFERKCANKRLRGTRPCKARPVRGKTWGRAEEKLLAEAWNGAGKSTAPHSAAVSRAATISGATRRRTATRNGPWHAPAGTCAPPMANRRPMRVSHPRPIPPFRTARPGGMSNRGVARAAWSGGRSGSGGGGGRGDIGLEKSGIL